MKKSILLFMIILISSLTYGQKKIAQRIFLYGNITSKVNSTVLIKFPEADPKTDLKTIKYFEEKGVKALSWNNVFLPGVDVAQDDFYKTLNDNKIKTLIIISVVGESKANASFSNTNAYASVYSTKNYTRGHGSAYSRGSNVEYTSGLSLKMDVYSIENKFEKPQGVLMGEADGSSGMMSSERSIAAKILRRMLEGLESERGFKL